MRDNLTVYIERHSGISSSSIHSKEFTGRIGLTVLCGFFMSSPNGNCLFLGFIRRTKLNRHFGLPVIGSDNWKFVFPGELFLFFFFFTVFSFSFLLN